MEESKQNIREHIMGQIPETIESFLQGIEKTAIRILGDTPNSVLDPDCYSDSIRPIVSKVEESLHEHNPEVPVRFVAADIYPGKHSYFVLDFNNLDYVYENAHVDLTPVPVYILRLSKRKISISRQPPLDHTIAKRLAEMHNGHGNDPLPLIDDHTQLVEYRCPRSYQP